LIDTIHAYGDFDAVGGCTRAHAQAAFRALDALGVRLEVFSNHGGAENVQNIGTDAEYHRGDHPDHPAYHADLLAAHGVRYVWTDSLVLPAATTARKGWRAALASPSRPVTDLLVPAHLHDGGHFTGFLRLRGTGVNAPNFSSLFSQLEQIDWEQFYASWGATMVYQHLGVLQRVMGRCEPATVENIRRRPEVYLAPFYRLQCEQDGGRLWVAGCAELLRYLDMVRSVSIRSDAAAETVNIDYPRMVDNPELFFSGLTIAADPRRALKLIHAGRELPFSWNGPDGADGMYSVTVTRQPWRGIW
jgi:hypothetical protein